MPRTKTLLMLCSSLGLGNATRLLGVAQALRRRPRASKGALRIVVGTGGKSAQFWAELGPGVGAELLPLDVYRFAPEQRLNSRIGWLGFVRPRNASVYVRNSGRLNSFLKENAVDLALIDSDYHCLPLLFSRTPIVALGQAWDVVRRYEAAGRRGPISARSMIVERLDLLFQRSVGRRILAPAFDGGEADDGRTTAVPLIVREEFSAPPVDQGDSSGKIQVVLSGSGIGSARLLDYAGRHGLPVVESGRKTSWSLDEKGRPLIDRAPAVLIQGGLSSIAECIARRRRMLVCPIEGHAEQLANALEVERRGLGLRLAGPTEPPGLLLERLAAAGAPAAWPRVDGADVVADALLERLAPAALRDAPA